MSNSIFDAAVTMARPVPDGLRREIVTVHSIDEFRALFGVKLSGKQKSAIAASLAAIADDAASMVARVQAYARDLEAELAPQRRSSTASRGRRHVNAKGARAAARDAAARICS